MVTVTKVIKLKQESQVHIKQLCMALGALLLIGFGITLYIRARVGVGAWDVLHASLAEYYPRLRIGSLTIELSIGRWIMIVGVIAVLISQLLNRKAYYFLSILTGLVQGVVTDLWDNVLEFDKLIGMNLFTRWVSYAVALFALGSGIALLVRSTFPPSPIDTLMIGVIKRFNLKYNVGKFSVELLAFIIALLINTIEGSPLNNIGIGTIISLLVIGQIVALSDKFWARVLRLQ